MDSADRSADRIVEDQIVYYRARAAEYDEWFLRQGRYDHGPELNRQWMDEQAEVERALDAFQPRGRVLELACGTGWWTERLARHAASLTAVDASPEVLELNRERVRDKRIRYLEADLFVWQPDTQYDVVFFSFWLSHVPPERFAGFWELVRSCLTPRGRFFLIDSQRNPTSTAKGQQLQGPDGFTSLRRLNDGRSYQIVKVFYEPAELSQRLESLGWRANITATANHFIYGSGELAKERS